jgi:hypothetical protein
MLTRPVPKQVAVQPWDGPIQITDERRVDRGPVHVRLENAPSRAKTGQPRWSVRPLGAFQRGTVHRSLASQVRPLEAERGGECKTQAVTASWPAPTVSRSAPTSDLLRWCVSQNERFGHCHMRGAGLRGRAAQAEIASGSRKARRRVGQAGDPRRHQNPLAEPSTPAEQCPL